MADVTFPTLSISADINFQEVVSNDPAIRSEMENSLVITRARFTSLKKRWSVIYRFLTDSDKLEMTNMQSNVKVGSGTIDWTNPVDSVTYEVRLTGPIQFYIAERPDKWNCSLEFMEV